MNLPRTPLITGNWKMYNDGTKNCDLARAVVDTYNELADVDVVVCPPFTALAAVAHEVEGSRVLRDLRGVGRFGRQYLRNGVEVIDFCISRVS